MDNQQSFSPQPKRDNAAKFAFLYMISLVALGFVAYSAGAIVFQIINKYISDPVNVLRTSYTCLDSGALRFAIAALIVSIPIYYVIARKINRELFMGNLDKESQIRKWLTYLIIFISSVVIIGWLIAVIYQFLEGELTIKFILKALTVLAVAGTVLSYYWYDIKREIVFGEKNTVIKIYSRVSLMFVISALIAGTAFVESPQEMRNKKFDRATVDLLSKIESDLETHYRNHEEIPENFGDLFISSMSVSETNRVKNGDIIYNKISDTNYELCAEFKTSNKEETECNPYWLDNEWQHDAGYQCVEKIINSNSPFTPEDEIGNCNVYGIELHGELLTYIPSANFDEGNITEDQTASENIIYAIEEAEKDENIKAIILEVDSYGGYPVAGEEVAIALKKANKPTVALIREGGASAAYMAASGADKIFASQNSDVGSIGVSMSYLDNTQQNLKEGLNYVSLSSGKYKDTGDPNKPLSQEEKNLLMRDVNILHQNFIKMVAENRNLDTEKVKLLADGSTMLGEMALQNGLIDQIGGMFEVKKFLKEKIGEDVEICW